MRANCQICGDWTEGVIRALWTCNIEGHKCPGVHEFAACPTCRERLEMSQVELGVSG